MTRLFKHFPCTSIKVGRRFPVSNKQRRPIPNPKHAALGSKKIPDGEDLILSAW